MGMGETVKKPILEIQNLDFGYDEKKVLENVNLSVYEGDFVGVVGPNGSAKSTLLKLILGVLKPSYGSIQLFGTPLLQFKDWSKLGYVSQRARDFNLSFPATVQEIIAANIKHSMSLFKFKHKDQQKKIDELLEIVGMDKYKNKLIGQLSGGQQQRVFIARALANQPSLLFLDEPTVGVDVASQNQFYDLLKKLNKEFGMTLVMVSHDIGVISKQANRIACISNKQVYVHKSEEFNEKDYIHLTYGGQVELLEHIH